MDYRRAQIRCACAVLLAFVGGALPARAAVVVVANRGDGPLSLSAVDARGERQSVALPPGAARPIFASGPVRLAASAPQGGADVRLEPYNAYYIAHHPGTGKLTAARIPLGGSPGRPVSPEDAAALPPGAGVITVKILVDDDEYRQRHTWESEIRQRVERASEIFAAHAGVRLRVVAAGTWDSNDAQPDFNAALKEFEGEVRPQPAQVAIGFSSQYAITQGRVHMGGTRGPLHSHILIKERANNVLETERLELLVHELGHFLGATHSSRRDSVMRPLIAPGEKRAAGAQVSFDPANTLLIAMMGEEIRRRGVRELDEISLPVRRRMDEIYAALQKTTPNDPASGHMRRLIAAAGVTPIVEDAKRVLTQIVRVAKLKDTPAARQFDGGSADEPLEGDRVIEFFVRQAAVAAQQVRHDNGPRAFLLALAIAVDDPATMSKIPVAGALLAQIEGASLQAERVAAVGEPTMRGRLDLTRHFFVSAELVALGGTEFARATGLAKELSDARGGTGFSFCDIAANEAGIRFAEALLTGRLSLDDVAERFTVEAYLPPVDALPEKMPSTQFEKEYGGAGDPRYAAQMAKINAQLAALSGYAAAPSAAEPAAQ